MTSVKQELRRRISNMLTLAQVLPPAQARRHIREQLIMMRGYCNSVNKTFIFVEQLITCEQFDLGGGTEAATLFRGPNEDASVAVCITAKGSLLYRSDSPWQVYRNAGDVDPKNSEISALSQVS